MTHSGERRLCNASKADDMVETEETWEETWIHDFLCRSYRKSRMEEIWGDSASGIMKKKKKVPSQAGREFERPIRPLNSKQELLGDMLKSMNADF